MLHSNDELRSAIHAWAESMQLDLELIATMTFCLLNKQAAGRARAAAAAAAAASSAPLAGFLAAGSPSRSLLSNAFAVPEDGTWAQQVCARAPYCLYRESRAQAVCACSACLPSARLQVTRESGRFCGPGLACAAVHCLNAGKFCLGACLCALNRAKIQACIPELKAPLCEAALSTFATPPCTLAGPSL